MSALNGAKDVTNEDLNLRSFGAHRAILVRDEQSRDEIKTKVENPELILTILESKGMEFEDVFLYDFFSTTPSSKFAGLEQLFTGAPFPIRCPVLITNDPKGTYSTQATTGNDVDIVSVDLSNSDLMLISSKDAMLRAQGALPNFSLSYISAYITKHLYVAITRAQNRLWIVESQRSAAVASVIHLFNTVVPRFCPWRYPKSLLRVMLQSDFSTVSVFSLLFTC